MKNASDEAVHDEIRAVGKIAKEELASVLLRGEGQHTEFKLAQIPPEILAKVIAAFANADGGNILLGVHDSADMFQSTEAWGNSTPTAFAKKITATALRRLTPIPEVSVYPLNYRGVELAGIYVAPARRDPIVTRDGQIPIRNGVVISNVSDPSALIRLFRRGESAERVRRESESVPGWVTRLSDASAASQKGLEEMGKRFERQTGELERLTATVRAHDEDAKSANATIRDLKSQIDREKGWQVRWRAGAITLFFGIVTSILANRIDATLHQSTDHHTVPTPMPSSSASIQPPSSPKAKLAPANRAHVSAIPPRATKSAKKPAPINRSGKS